MKTVCEYTYFESGKKHREPKANPRLMFSCHNQTLIGYTRLKPTVYKGANRLCSAIARKNVNSFKTDAWRFCDSKNELTIDVKAEHTLQKLNWCTFCARKESLLKASKLGANPHWAPINFHFLCCGLLMKSKCTLTISGNLIFSCNSRGGNRNGNNKIFTHVFFY